MNRHQFFKVVAAAALSAVQAVKGAVTGKVPVTEPARRGKYPVPPSFWYENEQGEKWIPTEEHFIEGSRPQGFDYMHVRQPKVIAHKVYGLSEGQGTGLMYTGESTWNGEDLVLAMANSGDYKLGEAILIYTEMCERCLNVLGHEYGMTWGYAKGSAEYRKCPTECEFCRKG